MKAQKFILLLLLFTISCSKENQSQNDETVSETTRRSSEQLPPPANLTTLEQANEQLVNYNNAHLEEIGSEYGLRTWISIEELKAYIQYVEETSGEKGIEVNGIDIFHTQYKKVTPGSPNPNNSVYEKTLMLAPTYRKGVSNIAFDPLYSKQGEPKDLKTLFEEIQNDTVSHKKNGDNTPSSIANHMGSCPNVCP